MSRNSQQDDILKRTVVCQIAGVEDVRVVRDVEYRVTEAGALTMDIYYPPDFNANSGIHAVSPNGIGNKSGR